MEEFKGDKRTKKYRQWKAKFEKEQAKKPEGLGDVITSITKATGIDKAVKFIAGEDCGCKERAEALNKMFNFSKPKCLLEDEYNYLTEFFSKRRTNVKLLDRVELYKIHNRVFSTDLKNSNCSSCLRNVINKLSVIIDNYK